MSFCKILIQTEVGQVYPKGIDTKKENPMTYQGDFTLPTELLEQISQ